MADWFYCDEWSGFGFPLNLWAGILVLAGCILFSFFCKDKHWMKRVTGGGFTLVWMAVLVLFLIAEGIGRWQLYHSWAFVLLWFVFLFHLGMVILRRIRVWNRRNALFFLNHTGIWLVVAASLLGAPDVKRVNMALSLEQAENRAVDENGYVHTLPFRVTIRKFQVEYHQDDRNMPKSVRAELFLQSPDEKKQVSVEVNKPVNFEGYAIYLEGYDRPQGSVSEYVTLQLVRDPWGSIVYGGILMMAVGSVGLIVYGPVKRKGNELGLE